MNNMTNRIYILASGFLIFSLLLILARRNTDYEKLNDPHEYAQIGQSIWNGDGIRYKGNTDVVLPPGYPMAAGALNKIYDDLEWNGKIISITSFLLSLFLFYRISFLFFYDTIRSLLAVLLFATHSNMLINATNGYSESFFILVFLSLTSVTLNARASPKMWTFVSFILLWPLLYYIRPEGLIVGLILYCWFIIDSKIQSQFKLLIPVVFMILAFPYLFFLKQYTGSWQLSGKMYANLVLGELDSPYQKRQDQIHERLPRYQIVEHIHKDPSKAKTLSEYLKEPENDILQRIPSNLKSLFLVFWNSFSLIGISFLIVGFTRMDFNKKTFLLSLCFPIMIYILFFIVHRMITIYHWVFVFFLASGLIEYEKMLESRVPKYKKLIFAITIVLLCLYQIRSAIKIAGFF